MQGDANDNRVKKATCTLDSKAGKSDSASSDSARSHSSNSETIKKLIFSFKELEDAINKAKVTLAKKEFVPPHVITRLNSYDGILAQQRDLANKLCSHMDNGNWDEVSRHVSLINGLSAMIREDAGAILSTLSASTGLGDGHTEKDDSETNYC